MNMNEMQINENLKSQQLCKYLEYFSGVFTTGLVSHVFFFKYLYSQKWNKGICLL